MHVELIPVQGMKGAGGHFPSRGCSPVRCVPSGSLRTWSRPRAQVCGSLMGPVLVFRLCVSPRPGRQFLIAAPPHQAYTLGHARLLTLLCFSKDALGYSRASTFPYQFYAQFVNF